MRMVCSLVLVALIAAPVLACPPGRTCIARQVASAATELPQVRSSHPVRWAPRLDVRPPVMHSLAFATPSPRRPSRSEMWKGVRERLYAPMPHVTQSGLFSMVLSPLAVRGTSRTVPGVGFIGNF
ncbi:hypothetical protein BH11MYX3_BH11MYX3_33030 [soil metagenome]